MEGAPTGVSGVLAGRKAGARTADFTLRQDGKVIATEHELVSDDGKTLQLTIKGTDAHGKPWETVEVFDRM